MGIHTVVAQLEEILVFMGTIIDFLMLDEYLKLSFVPSFLVSLFLFEG